MTLNLKQHTAVKIIAVYVAVNFIILEGLYFGYWCRPFYEYWQVPSDNGMSLLTACALKYTDNKYSSMHDRDEPPHPDHGLQYLVGYFDDGHSSASAC